MLKLPRVLGIEEYERLREIEDEMEDLEALRAARETGAAIERGEEEDTLWDQAMQKIREGKSLLRLLFYTIA